MNAVSVAGTSVSYTTAGSGRGLMLLHGTNSDSRSGFGHIVGDLAADRLVITPDYAGCGRSTIPDGDLTLEVLVEQAAAVVRDSGAGPVDLVGTSLGAVVAAATAATHPELVRRLVLVSGWADSSDPRHQLVFRTWETLEEEHPELATAFGLSHVLSPGFLSAFDAERVDAIRSRKGPDGNARRIRLGRHVDIRGLLPKISAPTLVVALTHDTLVPPYHSRHLHENIAGSSYTEIASGHAVLIEKPAEFVRVVREFVLDGEGPAAA
ncbi:alpha/beta fold hydrolase [Streptomyces sp. PRKS01-65]|nr:alpha/beta hydrolase [Streptomyces harenosi]NEY35728.1 alpha/beta fold hydrolase [Streptomyces harenosi]